MAQPVFISYSSEDKAAADQVCAVLEGAGYGCWIAPRDIEPGADYPTAILNGLQRSHAVVVIVTSTAVASPHVLSEVGHAFGERKPIIPFRLSIAPLPPQFDYFLSMSQWLDAPDGCTSKNLAHLQEAVSQALAGGTAKIVAGKGRLDKRILLAGAAVLVALAAVAYWSWPVPKPQPGDVHPADSKVVPPAADGKTTPAAAPQPWVNSKDGLTYVWIPPGTFTMGCSPGDTQCQPDESPSHLVELPNGFWLGQTEVTNAAYHRVVPSASFPANEANLPKVGLSRPEAQAYCAAVGGRLPSEAEWEYAARGGVAGPYYGVPSKIAWYAANSDGVRHEVATKLPNAYGLHDMLGSASEWVLDRYYNKYDIEAPAIGNVEQPRAPNATAVMRGGFWESEAENIRASHRAEQEKDLPVPMAGVRCVAERK
jgi:formylglycine-generating enzyme required for sulfatase activity